MEPDGWIEPGHPDEEWRPAPGEPTEADIVAPPGHPVRATRAVPTVGISEPTVGSPVIDLGQNIVGHIRLKVKAPAGTEIRIRHAEMLNPDGTIYTSNLRTADATDRYICRGDGKEVYEPRFTFHGFRYVELSGYPNRPVPLDAVTGIAVHLDMPSTGAFSCSNESVNALQREIRWTQRGNHLDVPTDRPQRDERLGWLGDGRIFVPTGAFNFDTSAFLTKWLRDIHDSRSPEGPLPGRRPPRRVDPRRRAGMGDAPLHLAQLMYEVFADERVLEAYYEASGLGRPHRGDEPGHLWTEYWPSRNGCYYGLAVGRILTPRRSAPSTQGAKRRRPQHDREGRPRHGLLRPLGRVGCPVRRTPRTRRRCACVRRPGSPHR